MAADDRRASSGGSLEFFDHARMLAVWCETRRAFLRNALQ
jgi:hypothetical protein